MTQEKLTQPHSSYPRNPVPAEACFRGGFIDSWGSGIMKIMDSCEAAGLPVPVLEEDGGGFIVRLFKDRFAEEELKRAGLNERQVKAVQYARKNGKITRKEYQDINKISKRTATDELTEVVEKYNILKRLGAGSSIYYEIA